MVDVAASGGYSVSYRASKIMADPLTITGSIGSISGKFDMSGFYEKIGVTTDSLNKGPNAELMTGNRSFTKEEYEKFSNDHWRGFRGWMDDVAAHRGIAPADIDSLCMGRIWTGRQAVDNKLIDALGGQHEAVELAKAEAGLAVNEMVTLVHLPEKQDFVSSLLGGDEDASQAMSWSVYQTFRRDAITSWEFLNSGRLEMIDSSYLP